MSIADLPLDGVSTPDAGTTSARPTAALPLICLAQLMVCLDLTVVIMALPAMQRQFAWSHGDMVWVIDAYTLTYSGLLIVGGRLGDLVGRRLTLMLGIGLFTATSLVAGLANGPLLLLLARAGQGVGAALATPTTLGLITALYPAGPQRNKAMAGYGSMAGLGIGVGLVLGGLLTELASWRWCFLINVPVGIGLLLWAPRAVPESRGDARSLDLVGALGGTTAVAALSYGLIHAGEAGWGNTVTLAALGVAVVVLCLFVAQQRSNPQGLLPLALLAHRVRLGAYLVGFLLFGALYPTFFFLTQHMHVLGYGPIRASLSMLPLGVGTLGFAVAARIFLARSGIRPLTVTGVLFAAAGCLGLLRLGGTDTGAAQVLLLVAAAGLGAGIGTTFVANAAASMTDVAERDLGVASGLLSTFQATGGTLGVAGLGSLADTVRSHRLHSLGLTGNAALVDGFHAGFGVAAGLAAIAAAVAVVTSAPRG